jgi:hypothetical protein
VAAATSTEVVADFSAVQLPVRDPVKVVAVIEPVPVMVGEVRVRPAKVEDHPAAVEEEATSSWFAVGAVAPFTTTVVVALFRALALAAVRLLEGVCQVAAVVPVAVSTCPLVGAVAALTETVVVADLSPLATVAVVASVAVSAFPVSGPVKLAAVIAPVPVMVGEVRDRPDRVEDHAAAVEEEATSNWLALGAVALLTTTVVVADLSPLATVAVVARVAVSALPIRGPTKLAAVIVPVPVMVGEVRERPDRVEDHPAAVEEEATSSWLAVGAVAPFTTTVVVALFRALALAATRPLDGVCQVAAVELVAVSTCPLLGAVAPLTDTVVVADLSALASVATAAVVALVAVSALPVRGPTKLAAVIVPVPVIVGEVSVRPARVEDHSAAVGDRATSSSSATGAGAVFTITAVVALFKPLAMLGPGGPAGPVGPTTPCGPTGPTGPGGPAGPSTVVEAQQEPTAKTLHEGEDRSTTSSRSKDKNTLRAIIVLWSVAGKANTDSFRPYHT